MNLAPSLLSADFADLRAEAQSVESLADRFHWDVMDGLFVPNLTFGPPIVNALRPHLGKPFDIHLMIDRPATYIPRFTVDPDDTLIFHIEASDLPEASIEAIRQAGCRIGICSRPGTSWDAIEPYLDRVSYVLVMSVEPGFGGQSFLPDSLDRIRELRRRIGDREIEIAVDGGIGPQNARDVVEAGADTLVAGSAIFGASDRLEAMRAIRETVGRAE